MRLSSSLLSSILLLPHFVSALPHIRHYGAMVRAIRDMPAEARSYAGSFIDSKHGDIERRDVTPTATLTKAVWVKAFLEDTPTGVAVIPGNLTPNGQPALTSETSAMTSSAAFENSSTPTGGNWTITQTPVPFLRGVNLGGWLVLEKWMNWDAFTGAFADATDEWTFSQIPGAADALHTHWESYFTEADIQAIAATGINALRIPIGYWAYDNSNSPYITGAGVYLERAIRWARKAGLKVWVDCHGSPGSQNGFDNSGHATEVNWQQQANLDQSISVLKTMAEKYGAMEFADVVIGLEMVNEPISWGNNNIDVTKSWAKEAFAAVKAAAENPDLVIVMHDAFQVALSWTDVAKDLNDKQFGMDSHLYQVFVDADNALNQDQHIAKACDSAADLGAASKIMPVYVGEWSAATNICVNPDGSSTPGTSCSVDGCQCQSTDFGSWNDGMIQQVRKFVEAQLDVFEASTSGYFLWSAKGPGGWGFLNGIGNGAIPNPITSRKYPGQCDTA
jgi:glucan 1,3-beta-glucosidase